MKQKNAEQPLTKFLNYVDVYPNIEVIFLKSDIILYIYETQRGRPVYCQNFWGLPLLSMCVKVSNIYMWQ